MSIYADYSIQVDCVLTWFPVRNNIALKEPKMRMGTFRYNTNDLVFIPSSDPSVSNSVGVFWGGPENDDGFGSKGLARAFTVTKLDKNQVFSIDIELALGRSRRSELLSFQSNTITPFLINLRAAQEEDPEIEGTALSFQGVVTASARRNELIYIATHIFNAAIHR